MKTFSKFKSKPSIRTAPDERVKREELKTYKELDLRRDLKSIRARKRVEASGVRRVLGDGSSGQPYLIVETKRYRQVRMEIERQLLVEARQTGLELSVDLLLRQLKPRIEALAYAQLAGEVSHEVVSQLPVASLGRSLTAGEQTRFAASRAISESPEKNHASSSTSRNALNQVLGHIEQRQVHNPARYQTLWAEVVGAEAAQQTYFDHVDAATGIAYFRCTNSALSYHLQRQPGLVAKLGRVLKLPIRKLRAWN